MDGTIAVAAGDLISAGEIFDGVGHVGVGIEQAFDAAAIAQGAGRAEADLHQAVISLADGAGIAAAFAADHAAHQVLGQVIGGGMAGNEAVEIAIGVEHAIVADLRGSAKNQGALGESDNAQ